MQQEPKPQLTYREALEVSLGENIEKLEELEVALVEAKKVFELQGEGTPLVVLGIRDFLINSTTFVDELLKSDDRSDGNAEYAVALMQAGVYITRLVDRVANWNWDGYINSISEIMVLLAKVDPLNYPAMPEIDFALLAECRKLQKALDGFDVWMQSVDVKDSSLKLMMSTELQKRFAGMV